MKNNTLAASARS